MHRPSRPSSVTVFRDLRPMGAEPTELVVVDGLFAERVPEGAAAEVIDGAGRIALPTLVDAHIHPDKTAWGEPWYSRRPAAELADYVRGDVELYEAQRQPVGERALRLLSHAAAQGTRAVRAHVDVAPVYGLDPLDGVAAARQALLGVVDVEIVAFPQHGVRRMPGVIELLEEAVRAGLADVVGGLDRRASTRTNRGSSTRCSGWPNGTASPSTSISTTPGTPAAGRCVTSAHEPARWAWPVA